MKKPKTADSSLTPLGRGNELQGMFKKNCTLLEAACQKVRGGTKEKAYPGRERASRQRTPDSFITKGKSPSKKRGEVPPPPNRWTRGPHKEWEASQLGGKQVRLTRFSLSLGGRTLEIFQEISWWTMLSKRR